MDDRLLNIDEAAEILHESVDSLYRSWQKEPYKVFAFKVPGRKHIKFSRNRLQAFIAAQFAHAETPE